MLRHIVRALALAGALAVTACGGGSTTQLVHTPRAPAAQGTVKSAVDQNGNLRLKVEVKHLARPEDISPGARVYVVWSELPSGAPQNIGALKVDEDLAGRLDTLAPRGSVAVFITAEESPAVTTPTGTRVLSSAAIR